MSSAFFANAASHIRPKGSSRKSKENKENEARKEVNGNAAATSTVGKSGLWTFKASLTVAVFLLRFQAAAVATNYCYICSTTAIVIHFFGYLWFMSDKFQKIIQNASSDGLVGLFSWISDISCIKQ